MNLQKHNNYSKKKQKNIYNYENLLILKKINNSLPVEIVNYIYKFIFPITIPPIIVYNLPVSAWNYINKFINCKYDIPILNEKYRCFKCGELLLDDNWCLEIDNNTVCISPVLKYKKNTNSIYCSQCTSLGYVIIRQLPHPFTNN